MEGADLCKSDLSENETSAEKDGVGRYKQPKGRANPRMHTGIDKPNPSGFIALRDSRHSEIRLVCGRISFYSETG